MRPLFAAILFTLFTLTLHAADEPKPNTLTSQEIADGWLLLFDGETRFGWNSYGEVSAKDGKLELGGERDSLASPMVQFGDYELRFQYRHEGENIDGSIKLKSASIGLPRDDDAKKSWMQAIITVKANQIDYTFGQLGRTPSTKIGTGDTTRKSRPRFAVFEGSKVSLRNVKLRPQGLKPIFNGKDLAGWKEAPNKKSKFTVTENGELNIKDGPGDLQTEEQWDDFILQLECISHGKHLNSGVFFRCIPGQYQNGYEAQIQNGYKDNDRTKPIDFGTGAIYRRVPARKVVSNDNEWFTMTVIAQGNHIATWVNGYQTVDWTDDRPADDNPRKGSKTGKGPISLQGHDPTTNLSFRNFRIAELPKVEKK